MYIVWVLALFITSCAVDGRIIEHTLGRDCPRPTSRVRPARERRPGERGSWSSTPRWSLEVSGTTRLTPAVVRHVVIRPLVPGNTEISVVPFEDDMADSSDPSSKSAITRACVKKKYVNYGGQNTDRLHETGATRLPTSHNYEPGRCWVVDKQLCYLLVVLRDE